MAGPRHGGSTAPAAPRLPHVALAAALLLALLTGVQPARAAEQAAAQPLETARRARAAAEAGDLPRALNLGLDALAAGERELGPQHLFVGYVLDDLATVLYRLKRYPEAEAFARRATASVAAQRGPEAAETAMVSANLAAILIMQGRLPEAAGIFRRAYRSLHAVHGPEHPQTLRLAGNLAAALVELSGFEEARRLFEAVLSAARRRHGHDSPEAATAAIDLARTLLYLEGFDAASALAGDALAAIRRQPAPEREAAAAALVVLGRVELERSRLAAAQDRFRAAAETLAAAGLDRGPAMASVLFNSGSTDLLRARAVEAEAALKQALQLYREFLNPQHPAIGRTLHSLAIAYQLLRQFDEADRLYQQAIAVFESGLGPRSPAVAATRLERSMLLGERGDAAAALEEARAVQAIYGELPPNFAIRRAYALSATAFALHRLGQRDAAADHFLQALALMREVRGPGSSDLPPGLTELAEIRLAQGRLPEAEEAASQAVAIREKDASLSGGALGLSLSTLAMAQAAQGRADAALASARRAVEILRTRARTLDAARTANAFGERLSARRVVERYLTVAAGDAAAAAPIEESFEAAQLTGVTATTQAVARMAARFATGDDALANTVRSRQDLHEQRQALDARLLAALLAPTGGDREADRHRLSDDMAAVDRKLDDLDRRLASTFPDYAELTQPEPAALAEIRRLLSADEALLLIVVAADRSHLWVVRSDRAARFAIALRRSEIEAAVATLRAALDPTGIERISELRPFDLGAAFALYRELLAPAEPMLAGVRHAFVVPDGPLQSLPLGVLVTEPPKEPVSGLDGYRTVPWLARRYAMSVLPSVSSLRALRRFASTARARKPFLGFGDPVFDGNAASSSRGVSAAEIFPRGAVDVAALRRLPALPETAGELLAMARALGGSGESVMLRESAVESMVRRLPLAEYRVIGFATHALVRGDMQELAEPALALTPPPIATIEDDGLLTASEVARLVLDADWVILSACNTAASDGSSDAEGLSGLAKAFFYAGARALLVSHWPVVSDAAVRLTTRMLEAAARTEPRPRRAEALQEAMLSLMEAQDRPHFAHPIYWAPFSLAGEGGRAMQD